MLVSIKLPGRTDHIQTNKRQRHILVYTEVVRHLNEMKSREQCRAKRSRSVMKQENAARQWDIGVFSKNTNCECHCECWEGLKDTTVQEPIISRSIISRHLYGGQKVAACLPLRTGYVPRCQSGPRLLLLLGLFEPDCGMLLNLHYFCVGSNPLD